jgi:hypothetical protein
MYERGSKNLYSELSKTIWRRTSSQDWLPCLTSRRRRAPFTSEPKRATRVVLVDLLLRLDDADRAAMREAVRETIKHAALSFNDERMVMALLPKQRIGRTTSQHIAALERENRELQGEVSRLQQRIEESEEDDED